jgi:hypothetical protein
MATARFRFHGDLSDFLPPARRSAAFDYACARAATLKNAIEALGVPHTEVALVLVNAAPATLARIVREGDSVEIWPWTERQGQTTFSEEENRGLSLIFVADAHLGGLARFLRMLGFDTLHENAFSDAEIRRLAWEEPRIVLTRDRELLKCREIARGCYVRARKPEAQLREVAARYALAGRARPFTLCLVCNLALEPIDKAAVRSRLPPEVAARHDSFCRCAGCDRIYWPGSHYERMQAVLERALPDR